MSSDKLENLAMHWLTRSWEPFFFFFIYSVHPFCFQGPNRMVSLKLLVDAGFFVVFFFFFGLDIKDKPNLVKM